MNLNVLAPLPGPARRGVFPVTADAGFVALQSIDSAGQRFMYWRMRETVYDPEFVELMWDLLDVGDPIMTLRIQPDESR
jgi:hypothetical protein